MSDLFWQPQEELIREGWGFAQQSRIGRFLGLSTAVHFLFAVLSPWLLLSFALTSREEQLVIRTVDFFLPPETAEIGPRRETKGGGGGGPVASKKATAPVARPRPAPGPPAPTPPAPSPAAKGPEIPAPREIPAAPAPSQAKGPASVEPAEVPKAARSDSAVEAAKALAESLTQAGDLPTLPPQPTPAPIPSTAGPKAIGGAKAPQAAGPSGPSPVTGPSPRVSEAGKEAKGGLTQVVGLAHELSGPTGGGPVATVAIPRELVQGGAGRGGSGSGGGTGTGTGRAVGPGGGASVGPGAGLVDTRDPDFSDYFRVIERRVRAAWKFPEGLEGTTQTVKLGFSLRLDGSIEEIRVVSSTSGAMNESALAAMKRAAPFPPLPIKFRTLAGQPLVMSFTVTIK